MAETAIDNKTTSAKLIKFSYEASSYDPCRGSRTRTQRAWGILLESDGEQAIIVSSHGRAYFFLVTEGKVDGVLHYDYGHRIVPVPEKYEEVRPLGLEEEVVKKWLQVAKFVPIFLSSRNGATYLLEKIERTG